MSYHWLSIINHDQPWRHIFPMWVGAINVWKRLFSLSNNQKKPDVYHSTSVQLCVAVTMTLKVWDDLYCVILTQTWMTLLQTPSSSQTNPKVQWTLTMILYHAYAHASFMTPTKEQLSDSTAKLKQPFCVCHRLSSTYLYHIICTELPLILLLTNTTMNATSKFMTAKMSVCVEKGQFKCVWTCMHCNILWNNSFSHFRRRCG